MTPDEYQAERIRRIWIGEQRFAVYREPAEQGGGKYARCRGCGREILPVERFELLSHPVDCSVAATNGGPINE